MKKRIDPVKLQYLLLGSLIANTGISFIWPLTTIYLTKNLHESLTMAGIVLFLNSAFTLLGNLFGGQLFDRWHPFQTIATGVFIAMASTFCLIFLNGWPYYAIFLLTLGIGNGIVVTNLNSIATLMRSRNPSYVFNALYFTQNLGLVFGSLIVGFILPLGIDYLFMLAFLMFLLFEIIILATYRNLNAARLAHHTNIRQSSNKEKMAKAHLIQIFALMLCVLCVWIAYEQWNSNISTYMLSLGMKVQQYSILWTLNAILIVIFQPILTHFDNFLTDHLSARLCWGTALFAIGFLLLLISQQWLSFALAMATLTIGEVFSLPAVSTYVNQRAIDSEKGRYQGFVQSVTSAGRAIGPLVGALLIENLSYQALFIFCTTIIIIAITIFAITDQLKVKED
ncbi:MDR family MFS transporter [Lactobacillus psittaci]|uniref:Major facilitator superfamily transporter permease n=1 Tax=Lactobacillus psittaci DSM 15354 TaxID=1122152 RepID=A0A0R1S8I1_9LACO|nr:MFS transporter [Lactobacillus psittaci]KRL63010.1 major facilitator superfamily transporter permease [Lactobacillus psittaci DSM 15354]